MLRQVLSLTGVFAMASTALAVAPGPVDGLNIPGDFSASVELAVQSNNTGFGNQIIQQGDYTGGSEVNGLFLAQDGQYLRIGITGNLERNGHAIVIFIDSDDPFLTGQTELRAEGVGGPPFSVQTASREVIIDTNGTPGDGSDDTWMYGSNGTILPCEADFAIAIDAFGGTMSISNYFLQNPLLGAVGTTDPTPDNPNDPLQELFASREFIGQTALNDNNDVLENLNAPTWGPAGFNNTNTTGVNSDDATDANLATTGVELSVPLSIFQGATNLNIFVAIVDGGGLTGAFVPQTLPPVTDDDVCTQGMAFALRADLSSVTQCRLVNIASLPNFTGVSEGIIDPADYGGVTTELQDCPTPYGDQQFDPDIGIPSGGSEINVLYADNDCDGLYLGITGNLEKNGNTLHVFIDTDPDGADLGTNGRESDGMGGWVGIDTDFVPFQALKGLTGDALPEDVNSNAVNWNLAFGVNIDGGNNTYVDLWNLVSKTGSYLGASQADSGNGSLSGGSNPFGVQVAYNSLNQNGVLGDCFNEESCYNQTTNGATGGTTAQVEARARSATRGFEFSIPWEALGVDPADLPGEVHVWAYVTGGGPGGFGSNQALPPLRPRFNNATDSLSNPIRHMVANAGNGPNDYSDGSPGAPAHLQFDSYAANYGVASGFAQLGDLDGNCVSDLADYEGFSDCMAGPEAAPAPTLGATVQDCLDAFDADGDGDVDLQDFQFLTDFGMFAT